MAFVKWYETNKYLNPQNSKLDYEIEWDEALEDVRVPIDADVLTSVWNTSAKLPIEIFIKHLISPELCRVASFCSKLQKIMGTSPFFLSSYSLADLLKVNPMTAHRILKRLEKKGFLKTVIKGNRVKANRYLWLKQAQETTES